MELYSIVIPTFNRAKTLSRAIDSVISQTYKNYEVIIVDDGSTDNTKSIIDHYKQENIKYIRNNRSKGACGARNTGILQSKGAIITFLDSDDTYEPNMLEELHQIYNNDDTISFVYTNLDSIDIDGTTHPFGIPFGIHGHCYQEALSQGYIAPTSVISARRHCFEVVGLFDESLPASQDDDICFKMAKGFKIGYIPKVLAHMYADTNNRISNNINPAKGWWQLWNKYEKDVVDICGNETIALHYKECLNNFVNANMPHMAHLAYKKFRKYNGNLPIIYNLSFLLYVRSNGLIKLLKQF